MEGNVCIWIWQEGMHGPRIIGRPSEAQLGMAAPSYSEGYSNVKPPEENGHHIGLGSAQVSKSWNASNPAICLVSSLALTQLCA